MIRRLSCMALVLIVAGLIVACGGGDANDDPTSEPQVQVFPTGTAEAASANATGTRAPTPTFAPTFTPTATITPEPTPTLEPTPIPIGETGTGNASIDVDLTAGLAVVTMRHYGKERFEVRLRTAAGDARGQLASDHGPFQGSHAIAVKESGAYVIDITADGDWELEVTHPISEEAVVHDVPYRVSGTGAQAIYFVKASPGLHTVSLTHAGKRSFVVSVMNSNARAFDRLIEATGAFTGTAAVSVRNEPFDYLIFDIRADGDWTLKIE